MSGENSGADAASIPIAGLESREFAPAPRLPFRVRLAPGVHGAVWSHGRETLEKELCGVLLGRLYRDSRGPFLEIRDWVRGEHARSEGAQVTFTHETWDYIHAQIRSRHPKDPPDIVGWYHTHPGFGIFLSEMDVFIHANFFSAPGQVALVLDPRSGEEGMFGWVEGKVERLPCHWVGERPMGTASAGATGAPGAVGVEGAAARTSADPDELDVGRAVSRIRLGTVLALLWGALFGWIASSYLQAWQLRTVAAAAAEAEVQGLVRAGILSGAQERDLRDIASSVRALAERLPASPDPAAGGAARGPRESALALADEAERLAKLAAERSAAITRALSASRVGTTTGELSARVDMQSMQVKRLRGTVEILTLAPLWAELARAEKEGRDPADVAARRAGYREILQRVVREDPGLEEAVRQTCPGALPERTAPAGGAPAPGGEPR